MEELIRSTLDEMKKKLLDLTRRNPLLSTKFSDRSHSHIRVVDEIPEVIYRKIVDEKMTFKPLPNLDDPLPDEKTKKFKKTLFEFKNTNQEYIDALNEIDHHSQESAQELINIERALIDKVRTYLGLPPRVWNKKSLAEHARLNGIDPSYNLPKPDHEHQDGRHTDNLIQTLLLPEMLERRIEKLTSKCNTWLDETGVPVLFVAYGFLEWKEHPDAKIQLSPLLLQPCSIEKRKTKDGLEYDIKTDESQLSENFSLNLKLLNDFGIKLPDFIQKESEPNIEKYIAEIDSLSPKTIYHWRTLRQVAIGIFPSSKMVMYQDLNSNQWPLDDHPLVSEFFSREHTKQSDSLESEEEVDTNPYLEDAPWVICDADSSQYAVIKRLINGENLAVEGPPGTGKSQTIVNSIAAAITEGKKVLFVAEKSAALNVVKSRLEANGIGEFCLPLLSGQQKRSQFYTHIRNRVKLRGPKNPSNFDYDHDKLVELSTKMDRVLNILTKKSSYGGTIYREIIGKVVASIDSYNNLSYEEKNLRENIHTNLNPDQKSKVENLLRKLQENLEKLKTGENPWGNLENKYITKLEIEDVGLSLNRQITEIKVLESDLKELGIRKFVKSSKTSQVKALLEILTMITATGLQEPLATLNISSIHEADLDKAEKVAQLIEESNISLPNPLEEDTIRKLEAIIDVGEFLGIEAMQKKEVEKSIEKIVHDLESISEVEKSIDELNKLSPGLTELDFKTLLWALGTMSESDNASNQLFARLLEHNNATEEFQSIRKKHEELTIIKNQLDGQFNLHLITEETDLLSHIIVFTKAGFFKFLSPSYWNSKKFYKILDKTTFNPQLAEYNLRRIKTWRQQKRDFEKHEVAKKIFGHFFQGLDTNIDVLQGFVNKIGEIPIHRLTDLSNLRSLFNNINQIQAKLAYNQIAPILHEKNITNMADLSKSKKTSEDQTAKAKSSGKMLVDLLSEYPIPDDYQNISKLKQYFNILQKSHFLISLFKQIGISENFVQLAIRGDGNRIVQLIQILKKVRGLGSNERQSICDLIRNKPDQRIAPNLKSSVSRLEAIEENATKVQNLVGGNQWLLQHPLKEQQDFLKNLLQNLDKISIQRSILSTTDELADFGLREFAAKLFVNDSGNKFDIIFETLFFRELAREIERDYPTLLKNSSSYLNDIRSQFAETDNRHIKDTQKVMVNTLVQNSFPPPGNSSGRKSTWTDMALVMNEVNKKARYRSPRELISRSKDALLELMPCWLMSPMAVAQYLPKKAIFDIVIIDEASQMTPENAMGTLLRGKQAMIVGDTNQLPPTNFFMKNLFADENDEEDALLTEESILNVANSRFYPQKRLRWHYRSKHSGLIAFSNEYVYENDLEIFPAPDENTEGKGVSLVEVKGLYKGGLNTIEAREIAKATINEMKNHPDSSIGVVTMNQKQKELIEDELWAAFDQIPECKKFQKKWAENEDGLQKFFVKNLENVQGDERDTIIIGTLYGPEIENGKVHQRFGPINGPSGKRRLNVLFSRARKKIITYTSMKPTDILATKESNEGAFLLKKWLEYSFNHHLDHEGKSGGEPDSDFERHVIQVVRDMGCEAIPQVGVSGYFIDIGVRHPKYEYGYLLGLECDGATYHSQKSARDRDRLREEVLRGLGWDLYRIWSTSWFDDPRTETEKLRNYIKKRLEKKTS